MVNLLEVALLVGELLIGAAVMVIAARILVAAAIWLSRVSGMSDLFVGGIVMSLVVIFIELMLVIIAVTHRVDWLIMDQVSGVLLANLGLVLGVSLLIAPPKVDSYKMAWRGGLLMGGLLLSWFFMSDGWLTTAEGWWLLLGLVVVIGANLVEWRGGLSVWWRRQWRRLTKKTKVDEEAPEKIISWQRNQWRKQGRANILLNIGRTLLGGIMLLVASGYFLRNGLKLGLGFGWPTWLMAATLIAWGVILPVLATTVAAAREKRVNLSVGNILTINIIIITLVVGLAVVLSGQSFLANWQQKLADLGGGNFLVNSWRLFGNSPLSSNQGGLEVSRQVQEVTWPALMALSMIVVVPAVRRGKFYRWQGAVLVGVYLIWLLFIFTGG